MRFIAKTLNIFFALLLFGITGLFLATFLPIPGNVEVKIVQSGSMHPAMPVGSLIVIVPAPSYAVGDVITFGPDTKKDIPTTHRIVEVVPSQVRGEAALFRVKGDANEEPDTNLVAPSEVIGKVLLAVPYAGFVLDFARQPMGFAFLIGLPALVVILDELANIFAEVRKLRPKVRSKSPRTRYAPALQKRSSDLPYRGQAPSRARPFSAGQGSSAFEDIRLVYTRRRVSDDMFIRRRALLSLLAAFGMSGTLLLGSVGSTFSYFSDLETSIGNIFRAGIWTPPADPQDIVLNEFLPNPDNSANGMDLGNDSSNQPLGEWVELYNNGPVPIDVAGWYLSDESGGLGNQQAIIVGGITNTGLTIVPAHGWLVIYFNKAVLNNAGTEGLFLYTDTNVLVDSYAYTIPSDFCELEPSPGGSNATSSPSGTPGSPSDKNAPCSDNQVAPNKSYARIPDGTGAFVDPVPTPGAPNSLDEDAAFEEFKIEEPASQPEVAGTSTDTVVEEEEGSGGGGGGGSEPEPVPTAEDTASSTPEAAETASTTQETPEEPAPEEPAPEDAAPEPSPLSEAEAETPPEESIGEEPAAEEPESAPAENQGETLEEEPVN